MFCDSRRVGELSIAFSHLKRKGLDGDILPSEAMTRALISFFKIKKVVLSLKKSAIERSAIKMFMIWGGSLAKPIVTIGPEAYFEYILVYTLCWISWEMALSFHNVIKLYLSLLWFGLDMPSESANLVSAQFIKN